jgi:hypothetical protein
MPRESGAASPCREGAGGLVRDVRAGGGRAPGRVGTLTAGVSPLEVLRP